MTSGEEKDIREFNDVLLSRIKDALNAKKQAAQEVAKKSEPADDKPSQPEELPQAKGLQTASSFALEDGEAFKEEVKEEKMEAPAAEQVQKESELETTFIGKVNQIVEF